MNQRIKNAYLFQPLRMYLVGHAIIQYNTDVVAVLRLFFQQRPQSRPARVDVFGVAVTGALVEVLPAR